jgi:hypothetical protein
MTVWARLLRQARKALERITAMRDRRTERPVPDYVQQLYEGHVALQNSFDQLQQKVTDDSMATQQQIDDLTARVQGLKDSLTHAESEIRTELDRLSTQGVDVSGLEGALDSLAERVQATEDIIPDVVAPEPEPEPGNPPPENPVDITAPPLGGEPEPAPVEPTPEPEPAPVDPDAPHVDNSLPGEQPVVDNTLPGEQPQ